MTAQELIRELEQFPPETEVRLAQQPRWAFEYYIGGIALDEGYLPKEDEEDGYEELPPKDDFTPIAYIYEGGQIGYLPETAGFAIGW